MAAISSSSTPHLPVVAAMAAHLTRASGPAFFLFAYRDAAGAPGSETLKVANGASETVDAGGPCTDEGGFVSLDISPTGRAVVAYYETDPCSGTGRPKAAHYLYHEARLPLVPRQVVVECACERSQF
jgi:hypothetical protein